MIRPERVRIEEFGSAGPNRVPAMVERLVYLGFVDPGHAAARAWDAAPGADAERRQPGLTCPRARRCTCTWRPDALRVLAGGGQVADLSESEADQEAEQGALKAS